MKAQAWSMDFIASVTVFILMFSVVVFSWNYVSTQNTERSLFSEMQVSGLEISDILVRVPGNPEDWNDSNVLSIGLADRENVLNMTKVYNFVSMDYNTTRILLGLPYREFYFAVEYLNGSVIEYGGKNMTVGTYPANVSVSVPVTRTALFGETLSRMLFVLYI
jgi:hypothetical protein